MATRLAARAELDLNEIWQHVAEESGNLEIADSLIANSNSFRAVGEVS
jgi:hypothetical protein